jgi:TonB family protein
MSLVSSPAPSTPTAAPARQADVRDRQVRAFGGRDTVISIVYIVLIAIAVFTLYGGAVPRWMRLPIRLTSGAVPLKFNDSGLRHMAVKAPTPEYPSTSLANGLTGVVVATVTLDVKGQVKGVTIVESPDTATGRAVRDAVRQWIFKPRAVPSRATVIVGELIFYFHVLGGRGVVSSSEELRALKESTTKGRHPQTQTKPVVRVIDETEFSRLRNTIAAVVLDTRGRADHLRTHRDGAVNIPLSELGTRDRAELPRSALIIIDLQNSSTWVFAEWRLTF